MKRVTLNQGSPEWLDWRRRGLGGSDIAAILGLSPYADATRASVLAEKVHGVEKEPNFAMRRGTRLEPAARMAYQSYARCTAPPVCVEMAGCPWARVSLDGLCHNGATIASERLEWILELKCPNYETHEYTREGIVLDHFAVQVQWQMLVCGIQRLDFASFNSTERFTPQAFPLLAPWRDRCAAWLARPRVDRGKRPELLDLWLDLPAAARPPMPAEWLAVVVVAPDPERQAWIMDEAARFWLQVAEARAALPKADAPAKDWSKVEAEFA